MKCFFDAFISYGRADSKAFATKLHARLLEQGFKVWFDQNDIPLGVDFQNQIDDGIEKAHSFLFIIAPHSINSPYCRKEIELAIKRNKRIIPLLHLMQISQETWQQRNPNGKPEDWEAYKAKGLHESYQNMHPMLRKLNWVYFQEGIDDFEKAWVGLVNLIRSHEDYVEEHTRFLAKALEWERHHKQNSYLLIGEEREQAESWLNIRFKDEQPPCIPTDLHCEFITESIKNANNLMTQVFISYADEDRATMEKIRNSLRRESITVWTNKTDIQSGEAFEEAINRGIEQADNLIYLLSPNSVNSDYCQRELDYTLSLHKRIIPVLVRETDSMLMPSVLRHSHYIDLTDNVQEEDYRLDESQLLKILRQDAPYYNEHKILLVKALKWKRQHCNPTILLRGYNLRHAEAWLKVARARNQHPPTPLIEEFITESLRQLPLESLDVFISYSRADSDFARKLNDALQMQGKTTWFDQESIASGADFQQEICRGIKACNNFLFILSPRSVLSPYCADEVEYAAKLNKRFVTLLYREVNPNDLHPELAKVQWIDFNQNERDFNANFHQLVRTLDTDREYVHSHTKWLQRAIAWKEQEKSADLLLRGSEFAIAQNWLQEAEVKNKQPTPTDLQEEFILESGEAIAAQLEKEKRQVFILKSLLGLVGTALVVAVAASVVAFRLYLKAERGQIEATRKASEASFALDRNSFDALIEGLKAGTQLKHSIGAKADPQIRAEVMTTLGQAIYWVRERDRLEGHTDIIQSVSFSPDGQRIATASYDNTVILWHRDGSLIRILRGHTQAVMSVSFSPDGKTIASASGDKTVKLWSIDGTQLKTLKRHNDWVYSVSFSPDGKTIASASGDKTVKLWTLNGKELKTLNGHGAEVYSVSFSPDSKTIASASGDKTVKLWTREGKPLRTLTGHNATVLSVSFSPDGKTIATASADQTVKLWTHEGKPLRILKGHTAKLLNVSFSPDGKTIATASYDSTIKLWNRNGKELSTLKGHTSRVNSVSFSPDSKTLASVSNDKSVKLWQLDHSWLTLLRGHTEKVTRVSFSPDGKTIATASDDKSVKLWNRDSKQVKALKGHIAGIWGMSFSPDGKMIATASADKSVKLWTRGGKLLHTLTRHSAEVYSVAFSPDSKTIATASADKSVKLWTREGKLLHTLTRHSNSVLSVSFSPDGKTIATTSADQTVKLWMWDGKEVKTLKGHIAGIWDVSFSPDGKTIATASTDHTVKLWTREGKLLHTLTGHSATVGSVRFSHDGKMIASASDDNTVKLWNRNGMLITTLTGHNAEVNEVSFSLDDKIIASASSDKTVILWNLEHLNLDELLLRGCDWVRNYLKTNPHAPSHICDKVKT